MEVEIIYKEDSSEWEAVYECIKILKSHDIGFSRYCSVTSRIVYEDYMTGDCDIVKLGKSMYLIRKMFYEKLISFDFNHNIPGIVCRQRSWKPVLSYLKRIGDIKIKEPDNVLGSRP